MALAVDYAFLSFLNSWTDSGSRLRLLFIMISKCFNFLAFGILLRRILVKTGLLIYISSYNFLIPDDVARKYIYIFLVVIDS